MNNKVRNTATVKYYNGFDSEGNYKYGGIFINHLTGEEKRKEYKTERARKGAVTKFFNKINNSAREFF